MSATHNGTSALIEAQDIRRAYAILTEPGQIIEVREFKNILGFRFGNSQLLSEILRPAGEGREVGAERMVSWRLAGRKMPGDQSTNPVVPRRIRVVMLTHLPSRLTH